METKCGIPHITSWDVLEQHTAKTALVAFIPISLHASYIVLLSFHKSKICLELGPAMCNVQKHGEYPYTTRQPSLQSYAKLVGIEKIYTKRIKNLDAVLGGLHDINYKLLDSESLTLYPPLRNSQNKHKPCTKV